MTDDELQQAHAQNVLYFWDGLTLGLALGAGTVIFFWLAFHGR